MKKVKQRELFADVIRCIAIISVLHIHTTYDYYVRSYGTGIFKYLLVVSAFTSAAVPLFYMLSGCFLLDEKNNDYSKFYKKILKVFLQTLFWSFIYIVIYKLFMHQDISIYQTTIKAIFREQVGHLWYMYPLIGLYVLTPFVSKLYNKLTEKEKIILLSIVFFLPVILSTIQVKFWSYISIPKFAIFFPELGLFVLGRYLYENKDKLINKKVSIASFIGIIVGLISIVVLAYMYIKMEGISSTKPYFDYNKIPNVLLDVSIFTFVLSISKSLEKLPDRIKTIINTIGKNSGGIYFVHMIFMHLFPSINILGLRFTANEGRYLYMLSGAALYFIFSLVATIIIKKIPLLKNSV